MHFHFLYYFLLFVILKPDIVVLRYAIIVRFIIKSFFLGYLDIFFFFSNSIYAFTWNQWIRCLYSRFKFISRSALIKNHVVPCKGYMCVWIFYASLRFGAYCHGIRSTVDYMWIPACLGMRGKRKIHAYFAQSTVQESKGCSFCSFFIQVWWKLVASLPAVLVSYIISLISCSWYLRN